MYTATPDDQPPAPQVSIVDLMDIIRRSFFQEVRFIEAQTAVPPMLQGYYETVRRSRLQAVRWIERQQAHPYRTVKKRSRH